MRHPGITQIQGQPEDHTLCGREPAQEVRSSPCSESMNLKVGQKKRILGEIQKQIEWLEHDTSSSITDFDHMDGIEFDDKLMKEINHLRLVGEVFSPDRFVQRSPKHDLQPGQAFDLRLGHQLLCPRQRRKCLDHILQNP